MLKEKYNPLYFLSSLGAGGLAVSFFMYLMFLVPHPNTTMPTFEILKEIILIGNWLSFVSILAIIGIIIFSILHIKLLIWNILEYKTFKNTETFSDLKKSNAEVALMTLPLTFTMTINVCFVLGMVFIPGLWNVVEYLFPFALIGFLVNGYFGLKIFFEYFSRVLIEGTFDFTKNNNLSQMISIFAFTMIAVGFAAPGAMSHNIIINSIGIGFAIFFLSISALLVLIKLVFGFKNMFEHGISKEATPSLWIMIPILTLTGITMIRIIFGLEHNLNLTLDNITFFLLTTTILSFQIIFGFLGFFIMKKIGYFDTYINGQEKSPVSFALICPGVAFMVFGMFFINLGLTLNEIIDKYSLIYFLLMLPFIYIQYITIVTFFKLKKKFNL